VNAKLMGVEPTGNGRRESYAHIPMPRMTNTYMLNGEDTLEQMIVINFKTGLPNADWHALSVFATNANTAIKL
jgi:predicted Zn-dependent protease